MNVRHREQAAASASNVAMTLLMAAVSVLIAGAFAKPAFAQDGALQAGALLDTQATLSTQATVVENEPNDAFEQATQVSAGDVVYGEMDYRNYDYFKINITQTGQVKLTLTNDKYTDHSDYHYAEVYNPYYERIGTVSAELRNTRPQEETFNFTQVGTYFVRIGFSSSTVTTGQPYHFKFSYVVGGSDITKVVPAKKSGTVKWTKRINASKYQVRYSTAKKMTGAKVINVPSKNTSKKIKGLQKNKKYFVQVRVVHTIDGKDWYSSWSTKKVLKTRK